MKIEIKLENGRWTVNGKTLDQLNMQEQKFMDEFFTQVKLGETIPEESLPKQKVETWLD